MSSLASFLANKCLEYLLQEGEQTPQRQSSRRKTPLYPPWSAAGESFLALCNNCGSCAKVCGSSIISMNEDGFPVMDFKQGACIFCGDCARSCPTGALQFEAEKKPWHLCVRIENNCLLGSRVLCRTCGEQCPNAAIRFPLEEGRLPEILPEQCDGCGACAGVCPVGAVSLATCDKGK